MTPYSCVFSTPVSWESCESKTLAKASFDSNYFHIIFGGFLKFGIFPKSLLWFIGLESLGKVPKDCFALYFGGFFSSTPNCLYHAFDSKELYRNFRGFLSLGVFPTHVVWSYDWNPYGQSLRVAWRSILREIVIHSNLFLQSLCFFPCGIKHSLLQVPMGY